MLTRQRRVAVVAVLVMVVAACGGTAGIPELTATPLPDVSPVTATRPPNDPRAGVAADDAAQAGPSPPSRDAAMAALLKEQVARARDADHLAADVTGDGTTDLVVVVVGTDETVAMTLATWDGHAYAVRGRIDAPTAQRVGTPAARDLDGDGRAEVLAPFTSATGAAVVVAEVADDASLVLPGTCPLPASVHQRLRMPPGHPTTVLLACDQASARAETAAAVLRWQGRHFETVATVADAPDGLPHGGPGDRSREDPGPAGSRPGDDPPGRGHGPDGDGPPGRGGPGR